MGITGTDNSPPNFNKGGDNRTPNMTTVRYRLNAKSNDGAGTTWKNSDVATTGVGGGASYLGNNIPLNSPHPGGVNVLLCDGAVRFVNDAITLDLLARLATRDDGQPTAEY
jgi:prepilin-type processing-associated H-X9-DG protein